MRHFTIIAALAGLAAGCATTHNNAASPTAPTPAVKATTSPIKLKTTEAWEQENQPPASQPNTVQMCLELKPTPDGDLIVLKDGKPVELKYNGEQVVEATRVRQMAEDLLDLLLRQQMLVECCNGTETQTPEGKEISRWAFSSTPRVQFKSQGDRLCASTAKDCGSLICP